MDLVASSKQLATGDNSSGNILRLAVLGLAQ